MKKLLAALALTFTASVAFAAPVQLIMATGGTAGTYYPLGGALSQIISDNSGGKVNITAQATGASVENMNLLEKGDVDLAITQNDTAYYAKTGQLFFSNPMNNIKAIARIYPEHIQVITTTASGVTTLEGIKGHAFSVGAPASGNEANARQIFEFLDMYNGKEYVGFTPHYLSYAEASNSIKDRRIIGGTYTTGAPNSGIQEILTAQSLNFINIDGKLRDDIIAKYPFFAAEVVEKGTYKGQDQDWDTIAVQACLYVTADTSEDIVYTITKAMFENLPSIGQSHNKGKSISLERAFDGILVEDLHPGAVKYYKEVGIIK